MKVRLLVYGTLGMVLLFYALCYFSDGVSRANYLRITRKTTKSEIHWLLGGPLATPDQTGNIGNGSVQETWRGHDGGMTLVFDEHDQIIWKEWDTRLYRETLIRVILDGGRIRDG